MPLNDQQRELSNQLVRMVQVIFGLVLAQSLLVYRDVLLQPVGDGHFVATFALATIFITTVLSWMDWHQSMIDYPYALTSRTEKLRVWSDVAIVVCYAYLLFTVEPFVSHPEADIRRHLFGYVFVFALYTVAGTTRRRSYGAQATRLPPIVAASIAYIVVVAGYHQFRRRGLPYWSAVALNIAARHRLS